MRVISLHQNLLNVAASNEAAFVSYPMRLLCDVAGNKITDWTYQMSEHSRRQRISVNGNIDSNHVGRFTVDGSSLIINEVKASDAGIYSCGHGSQLYRKLQLSVDGM